MNENLREFYPLRLLLAFGVGVLMYFISGLLPFPESVVDPSRAQWAAGVTGFVATCWLSSAMHLAAASLWPMALFPLLGVTTLKEVTVSYSHPILWLFFGGFILALGVERFGLHRRLALRVIERMGVQPSRLILGFMLASAFLSMWLSNAATTLLLLPIGIALATSLEEAGGVAPRYKENFAFALLIGIAYAASIGGMGTPLGTAPNGLFFSTWDRFVELGAPSLGFVDWMKAAIPVVLVLLPLTWLVLVKILCPVGDGVPAAKAIIDAEVLSLGKMRVSERRIAVMFALTAIFWVTRSDFVLGVEGRPYEGLAWILTETPRGIAIKGWWRLFPVESAKSIGDGAVSVLMATLCFIIPSGRKPGEALMDWNTAKRLPWEVLILIGGGIAIAQSFTKTGLAQAIGLGLEPLVTQVHPFMMVVLICLVMTFLTEVTSNTATTALFLPILASTSVAAAIDPRLLMLPATLSASCAFMFPVATPPNAIVFSSGKIPFARMAKVGLVLNFMAVVVVSALTWFVGVKVFGVDVSKTPAWITH